MIAQLKQPYFLDLFERILPADYLVPLRISGSGYELLQSYAKLAERVSLAVARFDSNGFFLSAAGGASASTEVMFSRPAVGAAVTVKAGSVVTTGRGDRRYVVVKDAVFGAGDVGPIGATVQAQAQGYEWNVPGAVVTAAGDTLAGEVDTPWKLVEDPPFADPTITVAQPTEIVNGEFPALSALGLDRGLSQHPSERITTYRDRVRRLPDVVSPAAVRRAATAIFDPYRATTTFLETWEADFQTCWDGPTESRGDYASNVFVYDDPRPAFPPFRNRWLDEDTYRGAFVVVVPNLAAIEDTGVAYNDTALNPAAHVSPSHGGRRASSAWSVPQTATVANVLAGAFDGLDLPKRAVYRGLADVLGEIKAAGVVAVIELEGE